jgi:hypothetical protein
LKHKLPKFQVGDCIWVNPVYFPSSFRAYVGIVYERNPYMEGMQKYFTYRIHWTSEGKFLQDTHDYGEHLLMHVFE